MSLHIPDGVELVYNTIDFPTRLKTKLVEEPVTSGDNRVVKYSKFTITISGFITQDEADVYAAANPGLGIAAGAPLDSLMLAMRRKLQVHGKNLKYVNKGYGADLNINGVVGDSIRDVAFGPKAGKFVFWPLGTVPDGCHGCGFEWEVSFCIAECGSFNPGPNVFVELWFTVTYATDEAGIVTITYAGNAQIPLSLRANNTIERNIDESIHTIIRPTPIGFIRTMNRVLSADRANCQFTITDTQKEVPPPPDVVHIEMRHRIRQQQVGSPTWSGSFTGTVRMSPTANKYLAWRRFFEIVAHRFAYIRGLAAFPGPGPIQARRPRIQIIGPVEMEEDLFKNESRFTIPFKLFGAPLDCIARASGLWRPVVNAAAAGADDPSEPWTADLWTTSLANNAQKTKGLLGATFNNADEIIIDVCAGPIGSRRIAQPPLMNFVVGAVSAAAEQVSDADLEPIEPNRLFGGIHGDEPFPPESSWVAWECRCNRITDHRQIRHKPLAGTVTETTPSIDPFGPVEPLGADVSAPSSGWSASVPDIIQQTASPSLLVRLKGYGVRVGQRVNAPKMISFGGRNAVLTWENVGESTLGVSDTVTLFRTDWDMVYLITTAPASIPVLANPVLGTDGIGGGSALLNGIVS